MSKLLKAVRSEIRWMLSCAKRNETLAKRPTWNKPEYNRGVAAGLKIAANALKVAIRDNQP